MMTTAAKLGLALVIYLLAQFFVIVIHEAGHLCAGKLVGIRWNVFKAGPYRLEKQDQGPWRFSFAEGLMDGFVGFMPLDKPATCFQWIVVSLAGCAANLLLTLVIVLFLLNQSTQQQQALQWLGGIAGLSGLTGLLSLWPLHSRGLASDGLLVWQLCRNRQALRDYQAAVVRYDALLQVSAAFQEGKRPRDWPADRLAEALQVRDGTQNEAAAVYYAYRWAVDRGNWEIAGEFLDRGLSLEHCEPGLCNSFVIEKAFWLARHRRDMADARQWLAQAESEYQQTCSYWRAQAAISRAEGNVVLAEGEAQKARAALKLDDLAEMYLLDLLTLSESTQDEAVTPEA